MPGRKTVIRKLVLDISTKIFNAPPPVGMRKADTVKCKLNGEQKSNVAKSTRMLKT
jgi:hypothetical protein